MMKKVVAGMLLGSLLLFSGCSAASPSEEIAKTTTAFTQEEIKANKTGVVSAEQENIVYQYVSNSVQVNKDKLIAVDTSDAQIIKDKVAEINEALRTGKNVIKANNTKQSSQASNNEESKTESKVENSSEENEVAEVNSENDQIIVSDSIANYMLHYFAQTPYTWEMEDCKIVGMDSATHLYFVDVYYKTTTEKKNVLPDTKLTLGMDSYDTLVAQRFADYMAIMTANENKEAGYAELKKNFNERWGTIDEVAENLDFDSPLKYAAKYGSKYKGIGSYAYAGTKNTYNITGAKVVYRMVMGYNYSIQGKVIIEPKAVYAYNSSIDNSEEILNNLKSENIDAQEIIGPIINRKIYSYLRSFFENDKGVETNVVGDLYLTSKEKEIFEYLKACNFRLEQEKIPFEYAKVKIPD